VTGNRRGDDSHAEKPASPRSGSLGEIGCNLDLANERKHIRGKPVIEQDFRINLAVPGIGLRLWRGYSTFGARQAPTPGT
jgi:hypothetical protein